MGKQYAPNSRSEKNVKTVKQHLNKVAKDYDDLFVLLSDGDMIQADFIRNSEIRIYLSKFEQLIKQQQRNK